MTEAWTLVTTESAVPIEVSTIGDQLLITQTVLEAATGWSTKAEGFCLGDRCVPSGFAVEDDGRVNLTAFAERLHRPLVIETSERMVSLGEAAADRIDSLQTLIAPDFELPDLSGQTHRLSDYRGKKILLASYASW
jgi:hypothetical protein